MDIYCKKCNEGVDVYEFHDVADEQNKTFDEVSAAFRKNGCAALGWSCNNVIDADRGMKLNALYDMLGDDIDGAAAMIEDFEYLNMI